MDSKDKKTSIVISGSFRKNLDQINSAIESFKKAGVIVLAPLAAATENPDDDFIILITDDPELSPGELEENFMEKISQADFLYVANINGYIGESAAAEIAYARLRNLPVVIAEKIKEISNRIPETTKTVLSEIPFDIVALEKINREFIQEIKDKSQKLNYPKLTKRRRALLNSTVSTLLKSLKR